MEQIEITSLNNGLVKEAVKFQQKKYRDEEKKFLLEGFKPIEEAFKAKIDIEKVFVNKNNNVMLNLFQHLISERLCDPETSSGQRNIILILTTEAVLKKISTTDSAPEAVAIAKQKKFTLDDIKSAKRVTLLENIKDLGNLGTILRTTKAFSQDAVILFGDTADLYNPKCVRSAVGNLWKIPVVQIKDFETLKSHFGAFERIATLPKTKDTINLKDFAWFSYPSPNFSDAHSSHRKTPSPSRGEGNTTPPYLIMFGSEAEGLSEELINFSTQKITIEMNSDVESLNLSTSVGIILYHSRP